MSKPNYQTTKEENETVVLHIINQMIQKGTNKDFINAIASTVTSKVQKGEVAEFQSLLKSKV